MLETEGDIQYIDIHAHLNLSAFNEDREEVLLRTREAGVAHINIGTKASTSKKAVEIAETHEDVYAIVGLHPIQTTSEEHDAEEIGEGGKPFASHGEVFDPEFYRTLCARNKVVGIGECGFDYWHCPRDTYGIQEAAFIAQIQLANELQLPLMIHTRGPKKGTQSPTGRSVYHDVFDVLKQYAKVPFNVHFYAGSTEEAQRFFEIGGTVSFTGVITFAKEYEEVVRNAPLDKIHGETDCPYVTPVPFRGKRNEPAYVREVYKKIAAVKGLDEETVRVQLLENARTFFGITL